MNSRQREYLELQGRIIEVVEQIHSIKEQLSIAKARCARTKNYSDSAWFHSANRALKQKQLDHYKLMKESRELKWKISEEIAANNKEDKITFERAFLREAKSFLDQAVYVEFIKRTELAVEEA